MNIITICPRSSDPFYIVSYYIKWVTTSWTHSMNVKTRVAGKNNLRILIKHRFDMTNTFEKEQE